MNIEGLSQIFIVILFIGSLFYLLMCVDPHSQGLLSTMHRLVYIQSPKKCYQLSLRILGIRITNSFIGCVNWLAYTNHRLVQIFYLLITVGGYSLFYIEGITKNTPNSKVGEVTIIINNVIFMYALFFYYKVCSVSPGIVNKQNNHKYIKQSKYDNILYFDNQECKTCKIIKPALSKHCTVCNACVLRFDHHCIWVRQCIGLHNYKWFITFLISHFILCSFTCYTATMIIIDYTQTERLFDIQYTLMATGEVVQANYQIVFKYLIYKQFHSVFIIFMTSILSLALLGFVCYHFYLIYINKTTAEKIRYSTVLNFFTRKLDVLKQNPDQEDQFRKMVQQTSSNNKTKSNKISELEECQNIYDKLVEPQQSSFIQNLVYVFKQ